jgi:hypothetical protein
MLLSAVSVLVVAQPSWEFPEGLMSYRILRTLQPVSECKIGFVLKEGSDDFNTFVKCGKWENVTRVL